jgi:hypothetical protein
MFRGGNKWGGKNRFHVLHVSRSTFFIAGTHGISFTVKRLLCNVMLRVEVATKVMYSRYSKKCDRISYNAK